MKSTWKIINNEKGISHQNISTPLIKLDNKIIANQHKIVNLFNSYFLSVSESIKDNRKYKLNSSTNNPINYLLKHYKKPFPKIDWTYVSTYEM